MRQLFVPACVCLMTLTGPTSGDSLSLEPFTGIHASKTKARSTGDDSPQDDYDQAPTTGAAANKDAPARDYVEAIAQRSTPTDIPINIPEQNAEEVRTSEAVQRVKAVQNPEPNETTVALQTPEPAQNTEAQQRVEPEKSAELAQKSEPEKNETAQKSEPAESVAAAVAPEAAPLPRRKPEPKLVVWRSNREVCESVVKAAVENDLPTPFFIKLLFQESRFAPDAVSPVGAQGIAQFMPATAAGMGLENPFDPLQAIPASARLLRDLFEQFGNLGLAAAAYNAGPKRIQDWLRKKGVLPQETRGYVEIITGRPAESWRSRVNGTPIAKLPERAPCQDAAGLLAANGPDEVPVPSTAPHRRSAEPVIVAEEKGKRGAKLADRATRGGGTKQAKVAVTADKPAAKLAIMAPEKSEGKADVKSADKRKTPAIKVATKPAERADKAAKKATERADKGALQLAAARKHGKNKKVRVSSAK